MWHFATVLLPKMKIATTDDRSVDKLYGTVICFSLICMFAFEVCYPQILITVNNKFSFINFPWWWAVSNTHRFRISQYKLYDTTKEPNDDVLANNKKEAHVTKNSQIIFISNPWTKRNKSRKITLKIYTRYHFSLRAVSVNFEFCLFWLSSHLRTWNIIP